jgi:hypothetical protein
LATEFRKRARLAPVRSDVSYIARNIVTGQGLFFEARRDVPPIDKLRQIVLMFPSTQRSLIEMEPETFFNPTSNATVRWCSSARTESTSNGSAKT